MSRKPKTFALTEPVTAPVNPRSQLVAMTTIAGIGLPGAKGHRWQRCKTRREALAWAEAERRNVPSGERFYTLTDREGRLARYLNGQRMYPNGMPSSDARGAVVNGIFYAEAVAK